MKNLMNTRKKYYLRKSDLLVALFLLSERKCTYDYKLTAFRNGNERY